MSTSTNVCYKCGFDLDKYQFGSNFHCDYCCRIYDGNAQCDCYLYLDYEVEDFKDELVGLLGKSTEKLESILLKYESLSGIDIKIDGCYYKKLQQQSEFEIGIETEGNIITSIKFN